MLEKSIAGLAGGTRGLGERIAADLPARVLPRVRPRHFHRLEAVAAVILFGAGLCVGWVFRGGSAVGPSSADPAETRLTAVENTTTASVSPTFVTGGNAVFSQRISPEEYLTTSGSVRGLIVDPDDPEKLSIEFSVESTVGGPASGFGYR